MRLPSDAALRGSPARALFLGLTFALAACDDGAPWTEADPWEGTTSGEFAEGLACTGTVCTVTGDTALYASAYRIGSRPTSRGDVLQTFVAPLTAMPRSVKLALRHLRPFSVPAPVALPRLHVAVYATSLQQPGWEPGLAIATGELDLATRDAGGVTQVTTFPGHVATVDLEVVDPLHARLTLGETYALAVWTDDLPVEGSGTLMLGVGALVDGDGTSYEWGAAWRHTVRRTSPTTPYFESRARPAGPWVLYMDLLLDDPEPLSIGPAHSYVTVSNAKTFTATGGVPPYVYSLVSGTGLFSGSTYTATATPGLATVRVTDAMLNTSETTVHVVNRPQINPPNVLVSLGGSRVFTVSGGIGPYVYSLRSGPGSLFNATYTAPPEVGNAVVRVTDAAGGWSESNVTITIAPVIAPDEATIAVGNNLVFSATGGAPAYAYTKVSGPGTLAGATLTATAAGTVVVRVSDTAGNSSTSTVTVRPPLAIVPATVTVAAGNTKTFTTTGGVEPVSYALVTGLGSVTDDAYTAPPTTGTATVRATDSLGNTAVSTITIVAQPAISPATVTLAVGNARTFTATGGVAPLTYSVVSGGGSFNDAVYTAPGAAGTAVVRVTDALGNASDAVVTVNPALAMVPPNTTVGSGDAVTFTATGGVAPYVFTLTSGAGSLTGGTYTSGAPGTATVRVTDALNNQQDAQITITPALAISPTTVLVQPGATRVFSASGGTPPYAFSVASGGGSLAGGSYTAPGSVGSAVVRVTDAVGAVRDAAVTITAGPQPSPTTVVLAAGNSQNYTATGGVSPYTFRVVSGGGSFSGTTYTAPSSAGSAVVRVTDSAGNYNDATITINAALAIVPATPTLVTNGTLAVSASGGVPPYAFALTAGTGTLVGQTYTAPATAGSATLRVTDALSNTSLASVTIVTPPVLAPSTATLAVGNTQLFSTTGGATPYAYSVVSGGGSFTGSAFVAGASAGTSVVRVTDAIGNTSDATVTVNPGLAISPATQTVGPATTVTFSSTGGVGAATFAVVSGGGSIAGNVFTAPGGPGTTVVRVTDTLNNRADATITTAPAVTITPAAVLVPLGGSTSFTASSGTPPYVFTLVSGGGTLTGTSYTAPGTAGYATIRVTDSLGGLANAVVAIASDVTIAANTTIGVGNTTIENANVIVATGATLTFAGPHRLAGLTVRTGAVVTHAQGDTGGLNLQIDTTLDVQSGGKIDVIGKGYLGAFQGTNSSQNGQTWSAGGATTSGGSNLGAGGSYGSRAAAASGSSSLTYGNAFAPAELGSGGGGHNGYSHFGGNGGGLVNITTGSLIVNGQVLATGGAGQVNGYFGGGGSGGGIHLNVSGTVAGSGVISAGGGAPSTNSAVAGGGGRIAIKGYTASTYTGTLVAGTILQQSAGGGVQLVVDGNATNLAMNFPAITSFDALTIRSNANLAIPGAINAATALMQGGSVTISGPVSFGSLTVSGGSLGLNAGGTTTTASVSGGTLTLAGAHAVSSITHTGGNIASNGTTTVANTALSGTASLTIGSSGVYLAQGTFTTAATTPSVTNNGTLKIPAFNATSIAGTATITNNGVLEIADDVLDVGNGVTFAENADLHGAGRAADNVGSVTVRSGGVLTHSQGKLNGLALTVAGTLDVQTGGKIDVTAKGYLGAFQGTNSSQNGQTYGAAGVATTSGGSNLGAGGSYGSRGGAASGSSCVTYGSVVAPAELGSGGGGHNGYSHFGGNGGGLVRMTVGTLVVNGQVLSNGGAGQVNGYFGGGGSGGGVNFTVSGAFTLGSGAIINAVGGAPSTNSATNGGGGRISIRGYASSSVQGTLSAGTVYRQGSGFNPIVTVDGNANTLAINLPGIALVDGLTVQNAATLFLSGSLSGTSLSVPGGSLTVNGITTFSSGSVSGGTLVLNGGTINTLGVTAGSVTLGGAQAIDTLTASVGTVAVTGNTTVGSSDFSANADLTVGSGASYRANTAFTAAGTGTTVTNAGSLYIPTFSTSAFGSGASVSNTGSLEVVADFLDVGNGVTLSEDADVHGAGRPADTISNVTIRSGGVLTHGQGVLTGLALQVLVKLDVQLGGKIDVTSKGYLGAFQGSNSSQYGQTYGAAGAATTSGGSNLGAGGSYGSRGGAASGSSCVTYGVASAPLELGSGGGGHNGYSHFGGNGGGLVNLTVGELSIAGQVLANGGAGQVNGYFGGGGSGGGIQIVVSGPFTLGAGALVNAVGGAPSTNSATNGGGGRVAIRNYTSFSNAGTFSAGTVYLRASGANPQIVLDGNANNLPITSVGISLVDTLTTKNTATVTLPGALTANALTVQGGTLVVPGLATVTTTTLSSGQLQLTGGGVLPTVTVSGGTLTLGGAQNVTTLTSTGGTTSVTAQTTLGSASFATGGKLTVAAAGQVVVPTAFTASGTNTAITVNGTLRIPAFTPATFGSGATVTNAGVLEIAGDALDIGNGVTVSESGDLHGGGRAADTISAVTIRSGGVLTHAQGKLTGLAMTVLGALDVQAGGKIDVISKGYLGAFQGTNSSQNGQTYGASGNPTTSGGSNLGAGGSYGSRGGAGSGSSAVTYGSAVTPLELGGGGGGHNGYSHTGGNGGGLVVMTVGSLTVNGQVLATGGAGQVNGYFGGGGAGGGINFSVSGAFSLGSGAIISALGGAPSTNSAAPGGGGRVSIRGYTTSSVQGTIAGGTVYRQGQGAGPDIVIDGNANTNPLTFTGVSTVASFTVLNSATVTVPGSLTGDSLTLQSGSLTVSGLASFTNAALQGGTLSLSGGTFGAFGLTGGTLSLAGATSVATLTASSGSLTVNGQATVASGALTGNAQLWVSPGATFDATGTFTTSGSGIAITNNGQFYLPAFSQATIQGTTTFTNAGVLEITADALELANGVTFAEDSDLHGAGRAADTIGSVTVRSGGVLTHSQGKVTGLSLTVIGRTDVQVGGKIDVTGKGYLGAYQSTNGNQNGQTWSTGGTATTTGGSSSGAGGSYGSRGVPANGASAVTYGSVAAPVELGSGGGGHSSYGYTAGNGGGLVKLVTADFTVNGQVLANGSAGQTGTQFAGGGSGGGVNVAVTGAFDLGAGAVINAVGGAGAPSNSGAGGGGRVSIRGYTSGTRSGTLSAGTTWLQAAGAEPQIVADGNGNTNPMPLTGVATFDTLLTKNSATTTVTGPLTGSTLTVQGGTLTVTGLATLTTTTLSSGQLQLQGGGALTTATVTGGTLTLAGTQAIGALNVSVGTATVTGTATATSAAFSAAGKLNVNAGAQLVVPTTFTATGTNTAITNNGTLKIPEFSTTAIGSGTTFTNNGVLEIAADLVDVGSGVTLSENADLHGALRGADVINTLTVRSGGILTHAQGKLTGLAMQVLGLLDVQAGGKIDVIGKGYLGAYQSANGTQNGQTYGVAGAATTTGGSTSGAGGSYGSRGVSANGTPAVTYGSAVNPLELGGGGGGHSSYGYQAGNGGGLVNFAVGALTINGQVLATGQAGQAGTQFAGGGAGGGINFSVAGAFTLGAGALLDAQGGAPAQGNSGKGGGGRISVRGYTSSSIAGTFTAGTVYRQPNGANPVLVVDGNANSNAITLAAPTLVESVVLQNSATVTIPGTFTGTDLTVQSGSLTVNGAATFSTVVMQAGALSFAGGSTVGTFTQSGGTVALGGTHGVTTFTATGGSASISGTVNANAVAISGGAGLTTDASGTLNAATSFTASGTNTSFTNNGHATIPAFTQAVFGSGTTITNGGELTVVGDVLEVGTGVTLAENANLHGASRPADTIGALTVRSGGVITHAAGLLTGFTLNVVGAADVQVGGKIDVTGKGYSGAYQSGNGTQNGQTWSTGGAATTSGGSTSGAGGSYGSRGGSGNGTSAATYGSLVAPSELGGGGGGHSSYGYTAGNGGGLVVLSAQDLTVNGQILANGGAGQAGTQFAGGGAGGGIQLNVTEDFVFGVGALIQANGGAGAPSNSAPGGGGRVSVRGHVTFTNSGTFSAGTIYLQGFGLEPQITVDGAGNTNPITLGGFTTMDTLTTRNSATATLSGALTGNTLTVQGGTLTVSGLATLGTTNLQSGALNLTGGGALTNVNVNAGTLTLGGAQTLTTFVATGGTTVITAGTNFETAAFSNGAKLTVNAAAQAVATNSFTMSGTNAALTNNGTLRIPDFTPVSIGTGTTVTNAGVLEIASDFVDLGNGVTLSESGDLHGGGHSVDVLGGLTIRSGGTLTHAQGKLTGLALTLLGTLDVQAGGKIDVTSKGYLGAYQSGNGSQNGQTYGAGGVATTTGGSTSGAGGSYGARGAAANGTSCVTYGSAVTPLELGSGGGGHSSYGYQAGNGGGLVVMTVANLTINGQVLANGGPGQAGTQFAGGGAGGGISFDVSGAFTFGATGLVSAAGGAPAQGNSGAGGGGRVSIRNYAPATLDGTFTSGTLYLKPSGASPQVVIDGAGNNTPVTLAGISSVDSLTLRNSATLTVSGPFTAATYLQQSGSLTVTGAATLTTATLQAGNLTLAGGTIGTLNVSGGALTLGGTQSVTTLTTTGGVLQVNGSLGANAMSLVSTGLYVSAGAVVNPAAFTSSGAGSIIANDGTQFLPAFTPATIGSGVTLTNNGVLEVAADLVDIGSGVTFSEDGDLHGALRAADNLGSLTVRSGGVLTHAQGKKNGLAFTLAGALDVQSGGKIDVIGKGYLGAYQSGNGSQTGQTWSAGGVATTTGGSTSGAGGSYGGRGANANGTSGLAYGTAATPGELGSGGGGHSSYGYQGGNGGGYVNLSVGSATINGQVLASGSNGQAGTLYAGGGSGGGVRLTVTGLFSGAGSIVSNGGTGPSNSGGGGGGRVAIVDGSKSWTGTVTVNGGVGTAGTGAVGSIVGP